MSPPPSQPSTPVELPKQFGRYRIVKPLGQGGMGEVYLARDTRLDRDVALKVCTRVENPKALERFRREAKAAAALSHPNLCPLYDYDVQDGIAFITMKFVDGLPLHKWIVANPSTWRATAKLIYKLAQAMQAAHDGGVIHRDLKPGNIAIDKKGEPIVLDFGLAHLVDARTQQTQQGAVFGTPTHMAPEQATGDGEAIGPATDVYALGVILYELLTGELPFVGPPHIVLAQVMHGTPRAPRKLKPDVPSALEIICLKAMAKKPGDRFLSMTALATELMRYLRSDPATVERVPKQPAAPPPLPPVVIAGANPDLFQLPTVPPAPRSSTELFRPKRPEPAGKNWLVRALLVLLVVGLLGAGGYAIFRENRTSTNSTNGDRKNSSEPRKEGGTNSLGMTFVRLKKGTFYMGWDGPDKPGKRMEIKDDFEIAIHTVTQEQWQAVMMKYNPSYFSRDGDGKKSVEDVSDADLKQFPVENVSWDMAQEFIKKLNERERGKGRLYRLPTEAEWEYACRGGATSVEECSYRFYFDKPTNDLSSEQANFFGSFPFGTAAKGKYLARPTKVGSYPPNKLGLYDMHGNVWQWCSDLYEPTAPARVLRGGCWDGRGEVCRAAFRNRAEPDYRSRSEGFRLAAVPEVGAK